uniref:Uncharacterized protein n=1 Tax=Cucumis melo TaxID=3656 RepID=A0A9I9CE80_CUCME
MFLAFNNGLRTMPINILAAMEKPRRDFSFLQSFGMGSSVLIVRTMVRKFRRPCKQRVIRVL